MHPLSRSSRTSWTCRFLLRNQRDLEWERFISMIQAYAGHAAVPSTLLAACCPLRSRHSVLTAAAVMVHAIERCPPSSVLTPHATQPTHLSQPIATIQTPWATQQLNDQPRLQTDATDWRIGDRADLQWSNASVGEIGLWTNSGSHECPDEVRPPSTKAAMPAPPPPQFPPAT